MAKVGRKPGPPKLALSIRLPIEYKAKIERWHDLTGETRQSLASRLIREYLDTHDPADIVAPAHEASEQEELPLQKIA